MTSVEPHPVSPAPTRTRGWSGPLFLAWVGVGLVAAAGLAATFTPFILLLLPAGGLTWLLARRRGFTRETFGLVSGAGVVALVGSAVAWWSTHAGCVGPTDTETCTDSVSPWPYVAVGLVLLATGLLASRAGRRTR